MADKVCLLTGASSGIGRAAALALADRGVRLLLACRDGDRGEAVLAEVRRRGGADRAQLLVADLASQAEVRRLATEVRVRTDRLDVLINNAGLVTSRREITEDGLETTLAVNHLAPFLLTNLLLNQLSTSARVVTVASDAHRSGAICLDDLHGELRWRTYRAYAQSKLANVLFTYELSRRLSTSGVTANCLHPGLVGTRIFNNTPWPARLVIAPMSLFFASSSKGAEGVVKLALAPEMEGVTGRYFDRTEEAHSSAASHDVELALRLWDVSERLTGLASAATA